MKRRGGIGVAMDVIERLARGGVFRAKELTAYGLSQNWLNIARDQGLVQKHGHGVWSSHFYRPTRYEILQARFPLAVFWGPSALWLHAALDAEPEPMWIAIANRSRASSTVELDTVIIRTRHLERGLVTVKPAGRQISLRAYDLERAQADVAHLNPWRIVERAAERSRFSVAADGGLLSMDTKLRYPPWHPIPAPPDTWVQLPVSAAIRTPAPARSHSGSTTLPSPPRR